MSTTPSPAFIEQALVKVYSRGSRTIGSVAEDLNINVYTLKGWMSRRSKSQSTSLAGHGKREVERRPQDWKPEEQSLALHQTHGLSDEERNAWCRERGLFAHHLEAWHQAMVAPASSSGTPQEMRSLKDENQQLKRELVRKEKALAEAAALLVLQKKFRALWEDEAT
jgi:transposase-like protein